MAARYGKNIGIYILLCFILVAVIFTIVLSRPWQKPPHIDDRYLSLFFDIERLNKSNTTYKSDSFSKLFTDDTKKIELKYNVTVHIEYYYSTGIDLKVEYPVTLSGLDRIKKLEKIAKEFQNKSYVTQVDYHYNITTSSERTNVTLVKT